jgi:hypothetical protein
MLSVRGGVKLNTDDEGNDGLEMATRQGFGIAIQELKNSVGVHELNDTHSVLFVEPGDVGGEVTSVFVKAGGLGGFDGSLIIFEGDSAFFEWVSDTGLEISAVACFLDAFR